jgi:hypothetical protein
MTAFADLRAKADALEDDIEKYMVEPHGALYSMLNTKTRRPFVDGDIRPEDDYLGTYAKNEPWFNPGDAMNYEDCGMVTGAYLAAQCYKWQVTGETSCLTIARRLFEGIRWIYDLGLEVEEGFFPKTYGGKFSKEISSDQYIYVIKALLLYLPIAEEDHATTIRRMIPKMADFWIGRGYRYPYFGNPDLLWPPARFPAFHYAAYTVSGDQRYLDEAKHLEKEYQTSQYPPDSFFMRRVEGKAAFTPLEERFQGRYIDQYITETAVMDIMALDECLALSKDHVEAWKNSISLAWRGARLALVPGNSGHVRGWIIYDPETKEVTSPDAQWTGTVNPMGWSLWDWMGSYTTPCGPMLARVGLNVAKWLPELGAAETVLTILKESKPEDMWHRYFDPDGRQIRPEHQFLYNQVEVHAFVNWLWAYWQGRHEGIIQG